MGADGEEPHRIAEFDARDSIFSFAWGPGGQRLVYVRFRGEFAKREQVIETCDLQGSRALVLASVPRSRSDGATEVWWLPDGRILYTLPDPLSYSDYDIWSVAADPLSGKPLGPPSRLTNGEGAASNFVASADGKRFIYMSTRSNDAVNVGNLDLRAEKFSPRRLTLDVWDNEPFGWTRDSKAVLFQSIRSGRSAILKQRIDQQTPEVLLSGAESYQQPTFSPAGDRFLYTASATLDRHDPSERLESMLVAGGAPTILLAGDYTYHCGSVPSARCVLGDMKGRQFVFSILDPVKGKGVEIQRAEVEVSAEWSLSPDGNKIAIINPLRGGNKVWLLTLADGTLVTLALQGGKWKYMQSVAWSADGSHLFATAYTGTSFVILYIDLRSNQQVLAEVHQADAWLYHPVPSPDGHYLAYMKRTYEENVMMLEHF